MERLQKIIAESGYCSRRKAEELITKKQVTVNGEIITTLGTKAKSTDEIIVEGNVITSDKNYEYYLLYKPKGVITSTKDEHNRKTVVDIINTQTRIYPIGRLDYDTTGLLLLTNDGILSNQLLHPSNEVDKVYIAKIKGIITGYAIKQLRNGVEIDNKKTAPAKVKLKSIDKKTNTSIISITIHEGKNHQIKKMLSSVGYETLKLKRESFAFLTLAGLKAGEYRPLSIKEVKRLYSLTKK